MNKILPIHSVVFLLIASVMTNAIAWAFHGEAFLHELDHHQHSFLAAEVTPLDFHQHSEDIDETSLNHAAHLCLSAAGQYYQPFFSHFFR